MKEAIENKIIEKIWNDICDRSGGDHFLGDLDIDTKQDIKESWRIIIAQALALLQQEPEPTEFAKKTKEFQVTIAKKVTQQNLSKCIRQYIDRLDESCDMLDTLTAENKEMKEENTILENRRGGECEKCGSWVCPPLTCMSCLAGEDLESKLRNINADLTAKLKATTCLLHASEAMADRLREKLKTAEDKLRWILVTERLPEENSEHLLFALHRDGEYLYAIGTYEGGQFRPNNERIEDDLNYHKYLTITHWKPKNPPPLSKEKE
ncbi:hypothetical protein LCGC14_0783560 [marine sediment metagenome]|uniref:DUF551 domain-containing protein n=1 Tax=marine sediment metagenome TaxID=412755 RepID=A0A0F9T1U2_9ZZZZ